ERHSFADASAVVDAAGGHRLAATGAHLGTAVVGVTCEILCTTFFARTGREIEHLQLLLAKLHRMQFGRKSEKLQRQIEQLELRLEELESHRSEKECNAADPAPVIASSTSAAAKPTRRALPDHLPRQTRRHEPKETVCPQCQGELGKLGEDVSEMLEYVPASFV